MTKLEAAIRLANQIANHRTFPDGKGGYWIELSSANEKSEVEELVKITDTIPPDERHLYLP